MNSEASEKIIIPVIVEKQDPPRIPSNASFETDAKGGRTYHYSYYVLEMKEYTVYVSPDKTHFIEELSVAKNGKILKQHRKESLNGLKDGIQEWYDKQGRLMERIQYSAGIKNGLFERYSFMDGKLTQKGQYKDGKKEGKWTYFGFGPDIQEISYSNGKYDGEFTSYTTRNGEKLLAARKYYVNGNLSGICESYIGSHLSDKIGYIDGKRDGIYIYYLGGKPSVIGEYSKGQKTGEWTYYFIGDLVQKVEHYKDGKRNGLCKTCYYRPSKKFGMEIDHVIENNYVDDLLDGEFPYEEFNKDGELILKGSMIDGRKENIWKHYKNNELIAQDFYSQGILVGSIQSNIPVIQRHKIIALLSDIKNIGSCFRKKETKIEQNGDYIYKYTVIDDIKDGFYQEFDCNEHLREEGHYCQGKKVGVWKRYDEEGSLSSEVPYENDIISGIIKNYFDGKLTQRIFVSGKEEVEKCPYERYLHEEITEQGECTIDQHFGPYSKDEKILREFRYGQPFKKDS